MLIIISVTDYHKYNFKKGFMPQLHFFYRMEIYRLKLIS
jgi:hypothetical protein